MIQVSSRLNICQLPKWSQHVNQVDLELAQPFLSIISFLLAKGKINKLFVAFLSRSKRNHVLLHMAEIVPGIGVATCSETLRIMLTGERTRCTFGYLEVFAVPLFRVWGFLQPLFIFRNRKEITSLISFLNLLETLNTLRWLEINYLTLTIGVTNSTRNSGNLSKEG